MDTTEKSGVDLMMESLSLAFLLQRFGFDDRTSYRSRIAFRPEELSSSHPKSRPGFSREPRRIHPTGSHVPPSVLSIASLQSSVQKHRVPRLHRSHSPLGGIRSCEPARRPWDRGDCQAQPPVRVRFSLEPVVARLTLLVPTLASR